MLFDQHMYVFPSPYLDWASVDDNHFPSLDDGVEPDPIQKAQEILGRKWYREQMAQQAAAAKEEKVAADAETKSAAKSLHVQMFRRSQVRSWRNHYLHVHCFWCWNEKHQSHQPRVFGHQCRCQLETVVFGRDALDML